MQTELPDDTSHAGTAQPGRGVRAWALGWWATLIVIGALALVLVQDSGHLLPHRVCVHAAGSNVPPRCFDRGDGFEFSVNY